MPLSDDPQRVQLADAAGRAESDSQGAVADPLAELERRNAQLELLRRMAKENLTAEDLPALSQEIGELWQGEPEKATELVRMISLDLIQEDPNHPEELQTPGRLEAARTGLLTAYETLKAEVEGAREDAVAEAARQQTAAAKVREEDRLAAWSVVERPGGEKLDGVRRVPGSDKTYFWDEEAGLPIRGEGGQLIERDPATWGEMDEVAQDRYLTFVQGLNQLRLVAEGKLEMSAKKMDELRQELSQSMPHLSFLGKQVEGLTAQMLSHPTLEKDAIGKIDFIFNRLGDPIVFQRQQEIEAFYKELGGNADTAFERYFDYIEQMEQLRRDIIRMPNAFEELYKAPPGMTKEQEDLRLQAIALGEEKLIETTTGYVELMQKMLAIGPHPYPEYDDAWMNQVRDEEAKGTIGDGLLLLAGLGGRTLMVRAASLVFGTLWDTTTAFGEAFDQELAKAFESQGLNDKDPEALAAFVRDKPELFQQITNLATIKALWAGGKTAVAGAIAAKLFPGKPIEDLIASEVGALVLEKTKDLVTY